MLKKENAVVMALPYKGGVELFNVFHYKMDLSKDNKVFVQEINKFRKELEADPDYSEKGHKYLILPDGIDITIPSEGKIQLSISGPIDRNLRKRLQKTMEQIVAQFK